MQRATQSRTFPDTPTTVPVENALTQTFQLSIGTGPKQRPLWQRLISGLLVFTLWIGPLQFVWQDAKNSASVFGVSVEAQVAREGFVDWQTFLVQVKRSADMAAQDGDWLPTLALLENKLPGIIRTIARRTTERVPSLEFGTPVFAAPIADPAAPIRFQPQVTQSTGIGGGVPVVNITAPNAAGISLNQYSQFNVDAIGLILNNSLITGGSTLGGTVSANTALGGRQASQIINQVTTQGSPSTIAGTIEVFGRQADVIIANPNGINCTACGFINTPRVVMTTGTPQFLSARGGAASNFDDAKALSYDVRGGHIQIEGLAGASGTPGAGIEGSAGVIDLIGGSIGVNASINAGQQINLVSGQQLVSEAVAGQGKGGSDYNVAANGSVPNFSGPNPALQIDATAFGAMNAGQIKVIATTAGLGVRAGVLNANNGNVTIDANGDVNATSVYGSQGASIRADGGVSVGSVTSYGAASVTAGTDVAIGQMTAANNTQISGRNVAVGNTVVGGALTINGSGNVTTSQTGSVVGDVQIVAGGAFSNSGNWTAGGNLTITANTVSNALSSQVAGLANTSVTANNLTNYGTLYGDTLRINVAGALDNTFGSMLAKTSLVANINTLASNLGGTIYVGDPNAAANAAPSGDLALTVSGAGSSFNNLGGLIAASNSLTVNALNTAVDPSSTMSGQLNAGGALTINAGVLVNSGAWMASGSSVSLSGTNGIINAGVIQSSGDLNLASSAGVITNGGALVAGRDLTASGSLNNLSGAVLHAERDLTVNGTGANAGKIEALRDVSLQGSNFDNSNGVIQANNNFSANLSGTLTNVAGTIAAQKDVSVQAAIVNNDRAAPITVSSSFTSNVENYDLINGIYLGTSWQVVQVHWQKPNDYGDVDIYLRSLCGATNGCNASTTGSMSWCDPYGMGDCTGATSFVNFVLPTVDRTALVQKEGAGGQILAGGNAFLTASTLSNRGSTISAGNNLVANVTTLSNGSSDTVITYRSVDTVNQASLDAFVQMVPGAVLSGNYFRAASIVAPSSGTETSVLGTRGMLRAGANVSLNGSGNLVNAGDLVAGNNITITLPGNFVNQGTYQSSFTTKPGCLPSVTCREDNAHVDTFAYQQTPNNVVAGGTLTVTAGTISNDFGTLSARGNVNLSANSLDNLAGTILSTAGDVNITASAITNRVVSPVTTHVSYGNVNPEFALGCNAGGTYKGSECNIDRQNQASAAAVISGARNVNIDGDSLVNTGGLITAGADANIDISGSVSNTAVALNTYWQGHWTEETCWFCSDKEHYTNGVIADGTQIAGIQAGNALTVISGGNVVNTGNLYGTDVSLSGLNLINGITDTKQPTAASTIAPQLVQIGPSGDVVASDGTPSTSAPVYAVSVSGGDLLSTFGPSLLVSNLPAELRPDTNLFYYDASTENNLIRQAAITQTGSGTFINGVAWSSTNNLSIDDQQKAILYNNAIAYATENNLQLGKPLTAGQVSALDKPMLWYTEQTVPDPACSFSSTVCGTVNALMPQVYLPQNYVGTTAGGVISGKDVKLTFQDSITNTGIIQATNLNVQTSTLTNEQRSVDIGTSAYKVQGGWMEYTGTQLQPGGFMSAVNLNVQADRITAIGNAFRVLNADGTPDTAGTAALLSSLRQQLGSDFTEITPHDNIQTNFIKDTSGPGAFGQVIAIAIAVALAVVTGGAGAALLSAAGVSTGVGTIGAMVAAAIDAAIAGTLSSMATQVITTGRLDLGSALKSGVVSGLVAGVTAGVTGNMPGGGEGTNTVTPGTSGTTPISQADWVTAMANKGQFAINTAVRSSISAAVNSAVYGGSFGTAFLNGVVSSVAAVGANGIGASANPYTIENVLGHALLGCAAATLSGNDCAGGAVGGAASALVAPTIRDALYGDDALHYNDRTYNATVVALAALAGGSLAIALGTNASAAANASVNEALNNSLSDPIRKIINAGQNCNSQQCVLDAAATVSKAYQTASDNVVQACSAADSTACQQAKSDRVALYNELDRLRVVVSSMSNCQTAGCVAVNTGGAGAIAVVGGAVAARAISAARGLIGRLLGTEAEVIVAEKPIGVNTVATGETAGDTSPNYGNQISGYGKTTITDVNGNPIPTGVPTTTAAGANTNTAAVQSQFTQDYLAGSGGRWGTPATRQLNYDVGQILEQSGNYKVTGGGGIASEEYIPGSGPGTTGSSYVDITARSVNGGPTIRVQTVTTQANGVTPTPSEAAAAARIQNAYPTDILVVIPKGSTPAQVKQAIQQAISKAGP